MPTIIKRRRNKNKPRDPPHDECEDLAGHMVEVQACYCIRAKERKNPYKEAWSLICVHSQASKSCGGYPTWVSFLLLALQATIYMSVRATTYEWLFLPVVHMVRWIDQILCSASSACIL